MGELSLKQREQRDGYQDETPGQPKTTRDFLQKILGMVRLLCRSQVVIDRDLEEIKMRQVPTIDAQHKMIGYLSNQLEQAQAKLADSQKECGALRNGAPLVAREADQVFRPVNGDRTFGADRIWLVRRPAFLHVDRDGNMTELPPELARRLLSTGLWTHEAKPFPESSIPRISSETSNSENSCIDSARIPPTAPAC